jgi:hypothetical protein
MSSAPKLVQNLRAYNESKDALRDKIESMLIGRLYCNR